jgi:iron(III) transport system permease protein
LGALRLGVTLIVTLTITVLIFMPLAAVFLTSLQANWGSMRGLGFGHWHSVLSNARTLSAAGRSTVLSLTAAMLVTGLGLVIALTRRRWLETLGDAIFALPGTVFALALLVAFSRDVRVIVFERVAIVIALGNTLTLLLIAYVAKHLAYGTRNVSDGLSGLDPSLTEAARLSGATQRRAFIDTVLPQLRGPLMTAALLTFLTCMTELTVSVLLIPSGSEVLGTLVFELQSYADPGSAAVIACAFIGLVMIATILATTMNSRRRRRGVA